MRRFSNFINKPFFKHLIILLILFLIYTYFCAFSYVNAVSSNLSENVFRLHVVANSDSAEDQNLKYIVRDNLLNYMNKIAAGSTSKEETIKLAYENLDIFNEIALETVRANGYDYDVNIKIDNMFFPTKTYGDISLPAGLYDGMKVQIGSGKGQNWWCVMFPSLCFIDVTSGEVPKEGKELLENNLEEETYSLISNNSNNELTFKFKLLEFFAKNNIFTAKK